MRYIVILQKEVELEMATEEYLFAALSGLDRLCDSLVGCRVQIEERCSAGEDRGAVNVIMTLDTGEHRIRVSNADTHPGKRLGAKDAILAALGEAEEALRGLKEAGKCGTCCAGSDSLPSSTKKAFGPQLVRRADTRRARHI